MLSSQLNLALALAGCHAGGLYEVFPALQDAEAENLAQMGRAVGRASRNDTSQPVLTDWPFSSRGGTRTRDPGIMSAVL